MRGGGKVELLIPTKRNLELWGEEHPHKTYFQGRERLRSRASGGQRGRTRGRKGQTQKVYEREKE